MKLRPLANHRAAQRFIPSRSTGGAAGFSPRYTVHLAKWALALGLLLPAPAAHAQGCAQCRDNLQSTPPAVQAAYRHAIELLALSGLTLFTGGIILLRRYR